MKHKAASQASRLSPRHTPRHILHLQHYVSDIVSFMTSEFDSKALKRPGARRPALQCSAAWSRSQHLQTGRARIYETRNFSLSITGATSGQVGAGGLRLRLQRRHTTSSTEIEAKHSVKTAWVKVVRGSWDNG